MSALGACIDSLGPWGILLEMEALFVKIHSYLYLGSQETAKIEACRLLLIIAIHLTSIPDCDIGIYYRHTLLALRHCCEDKEVSVSAMAKDALAEWEKLDYLFG